MNGYISISDAAEKWGVSERRINQYCAEGRISGAERFGISWAIPQDAEKPGDPRKQKREARALPKVPKLIPGFMPLMNTPFVPGRCAEVIAGMKAGPQKDIALAEYHYFSGQAEKAMQETERYLAAADGAVRLSACWIFAYSCLTMGRIDHAHHALQEIRKTLADGGENAPSIRAIETLTRKAPLPALKLRLCSKASLRKTILCLLFPAGMAAQTEPAAVAEHSESQAHHGVGFIGKLPLWEMLKPTVFECIYSKQSVFIILLLSEFRISSGFYHVLRLVGIACLHFRNRISKQMRL